MAGRSHDGDPYLLIYALPSILGAAQDVQIPHLQGPITTYGAGLLAPPLIPST